MTAIIDDLIKGLGAYITPEALERALTHRSFAYENDGAATNERLEFLGDSVLGLSVTDYLYRTFPDLPEGDLARLRSALVSTRALARVARQLDVGQHIRLGAGEQLTKGRDKDSILADTMEAILGAVYLSTSFDAARETVLRLFTPLLSDVDAMTAGKDWKTTIQELAASKELGDVRYDVEGFGPDHQRSFTATARIGQAQFGQGEGPSKKEAERAAARAAVERMTADSPAAGDVISLVLDRFDTA